MSRRFTVISAALFAGAIPSATAADATVTVSITQSGPDVVATASGVLDLTGLSSAGGFNTGGIIDPHLAFVALGAFGTVDLYLGLSGPSQFGSGGSTTTLTSAGSTFGLGGSNSTIFVPAGYVSGSPISSTTTFLAATLASLGLTPGQYIYSTPNDSVIVNVSSATSGVPEPSTWAMMLMGLGALGLALRRWKRAGTLVQLA